MSAAGFWDNQERAQQVVAELKAVKGIVKPLEEAEASTGDLMAMLELADEDPSFEPEVRHRNRANRLPRWQSSRRREPSTSPS